MAIYRMLNGMVFAPEDLKTMTTAYEAVLADLSLADRNDPLTDIIASKVIALFQTGTHEADRLAELTLEEISGSMISDRNEPFAEPRRRVE